MFRLVNELDNCDKNLVIFSCSLLVIFISLTGHFFNISEKLEALYLLPLVILSWYGGKTAGFTLVALIAVLSVLTKATQLETLTFTINDMLYFTIELTIYLLITLLIINFRTAHNKEYNLANKDYLTGLLNVRSFSVELANEILRSIRYNHTFSLSYIDIDNFKDINDTLGHQEGDKLLKVVSQTLVSSLRKTDVIARLGGDEFAIIFPETSQAEVKSAFEKASLSLKKVMANKKWNVSFSVGIVTFESLPKDIKEALKIADDLMYSVKSNKKNRVAFQVWQDRVE